jgi:hypothetical protein
MVSRKESTPRSYDLEKRRRKKKTRKEKKG